MSIVTLKNITKTFGIGDLAFNALNDINLSIDTSAFTAVSGPSGSGKSTLLNIIGSLDTPTQGEIFFNNQKIDFSNSKKINDIRNFDLGFIFQNFNLLPVLTAVENIEIAALQSISSTKERKKQARILLAQVGLSDKENSFPYELSGGQQQRVSVARALIGNPKLILADEPTANLDSKNTFILIDLMKRLNKELHIAFLFSTHDERLLKNVTTTIKLIDGKIV
jgi:putative ABC transport system ATP-binding protein